MSDTKKTPVTRAALMTIVAEVMATLPDTLTVDDGMSAWTKISSVASGNKVYVPKREGAVKEVHISGWGKGLAGTVEPPKKIGKVEAFLDLEADDVEGNFRALINDLALQSPKAAKAKPAPAEKPVGEKPAPRRAKGDASAEESRVEEIKRRAAELGLGVSVELDKDGSAKDPEAFAEAVDAVARDMQRESEPAEAEVFVLSDPDLDVIVTAEQLEDAAPAMA